MTQEVPKRLLKTLYCPASDASILNYNQVKIRREGDLYIVTPVGPLMSTQQMFDQRNKAKDKDTAVQAQKLNELNDKIKRELSGDGHVFANIGLSSLLTTSYEGKDYVALTRSNKKTVWADFGNKEAEVMKAVSGYIETENTATPINALGAEIEAEILPETSDGKILPALLDGKKLRRPFEGEYPLFQYEKGAGFNVKSQGIWNPFPKRRVMIAGKPVEGDPSIYFHVGTDSAQLLFSNHLDFMPDESIVRKLGLSLNHSEDKRSEDKQNLDTFYHPEGIVLVELADGKMTKNVYTLVNGKLKPFTDGVELSELFVPRGSDDIIPMGKDTIRLEDIVR